MLRSRWKQPKLQKTIAEGIIQELYGELNDQRKAECQHKVQIILWYFIVLF